MPRPIEASFDGCRKITVTVAGEEVVFSIVERPKWMDRSTQDAYANSMVHALHSAAYINVFEERVSAVKLLRQMGTGSLEVKTDVVSGNVGELIKVLKKELEKTWLTALEEGQKVTQLLEQSIKELENE